jgi:hypothetical protein
MLVVRAIRKQKDIQTDVMSSGHAESELESPISHLAKAGAIADTI